KRSDVWAFGCVLFEMLTGKQAFDGVDVAETLAAVLRADPDWSTLPAEVPASIVTVLRRCLEKDRRRRIADVAAAQFVLTEYERLSTSTAAPSETSATARSARWPTLSVAAVAMVATAGVTAWALIGNRVPATPQPTRRFTITLPEGASVPGA